MAQAASGLWVADQFDNRVLRVDRRVPAQAGFDFGAKTLAGEERLRTPVGGSPVDDP